MRNTYIFGDSHGVRDSFFCMLCMDLLSQDWVSLLHAIADDHVFDLVAATTAKVDEIIIHFHRVDWYLEPVRLLRLTRDFHILLLLGWCCCHFDTIPLFLLQIEI